MHSMAVDDQVFLDIPVKKSKYCISQEPEWSALEEFSGHN